MANVWERTACVQLLFPQCMGWLYVSCPGILRKRESQITVSGKETDQRGMEGQTKRDAEADERWREIPQSWPQPSEFRCCVVQGSLLALSFHLPSDLKWHRLLFSLKKEHNLKLLGPETPRWGSST